MIHIDFDLRSEFKVLTNLIISSFASVDSGKPIHVPRVNVHGNVMFWNSERSAEVRQFYSSRVLCFRSIMTYSYNLTYSSN